MVAAWRREGLRIAVVPTMGALHEGMKPATERNESSIRAPSIRLSKRRAHYARDRYNGHRPKLPVV
ncbi:pantoate--beta-alanine ligase [Mesorhizobium sp. PL10]